MNRKHILYLLQVNLQNWDKNEPAGSFLNNRNNRNNMESYVEMTVKKSMSGCFSCAGKFLA